MVLHINEGAATCYMAIGLYVELHCCTPPPDGVIDYPGIARGRVGRGEVWWGGAGLG